MVNQLLGYCSYCAGIANDGIGDGQRTEGEEMPMDYDVSCGQGSCVDHPDIKTPEPQGG